MISRISVSRETEALCSGRASAALAIASAQARKAAGRLERVQAAAKAQASAATFIGFLGLIGTLYAAFMPIESAEVRAGVALAATIAMAVPLGMTCYWCLREGHDREIEAATALEAANRTAAFAKRIGHAVSSASDAMGLSPTAVVVLAPLLDMVEREADCSRHREQTMYNAEQRGERRAGPRIKPVHDRVIVTTADGRKLTAHVIDMSMAGVALDTDLPGIGLGSTLMIGSRKALAVRRLAKGMVFQFEVPIAAETFNPEIML